MEVRLEQISYVLCIQSVLPVDMWQDFPSRIGGATRVPKLTGNQVLRKRLKHKEDSKMKRVGAGQVLKVSTLASTVLALRRIGLSSSASAEPMPEREKTL